MPSISGINHVSVTVTDLDRSRAWYQDVLGLGVLMQERHPDAASFILVGLPDWSMSIGLTWHPGNKGERFSETRTGLDHIAFLAASRGDLDEWEARLTDKGVVHSAVSDQDGYSVLVLRDPDNIQLELMSTGGNNSEQA